MVMMRLTRITIYFVYYKNKLKLIEINIFLPKALQHSCEKEVLYETLNYLIK